MGYMGRWQSQSCCLPFCLIAYGVVLLMLALLDSHMILGYRRLSAKYARVMRS